MTFEAILGVGHDLDGGRLMVMKRRSVKVTINEDNRLKFTVESTVGEAMMLQKSSMTVSPAPTLLVQLT